jgi:hypothetical protein
VRHGQVIDVAHADGSPPWTVRWTDDDRTSVVVPGSDATIEHHPPSPEDRGGTRAAEP